jgi:23S rRNA U2552 (ribose-2'-O)-methylase RlmE/FtsJ
MSGSGSARSHSDSQKPRLMGLAENVWHFASQYLAVGGSFMCKISRGGEENEVCKGEFACLTTRTVLSVTTQLMVSLTHVYGFAG